MSDQGSWDEDIPRPFFFLSYAHSPRGAGRPNTAASHWEDQLFRDLCEAVTELAGLEEGEPPGFMDRGLNLGEGWSGRITEALAHCRVFVPLYSPRYFRSQACGQEWAAFASREVLPKNRSSGHITGVVPVQWVVVHQDSLPGVARALQFDHRDFGEEYLTEGLQTLLKVRYFRVQYELAVHRLAQRIVQVAEDTMIKLGGRRDFQDLPSAFDPPTRRRQLRISVLACDRKNLPEGRSPDSYGVNQVDWQPYGDNADSSLAKRAAAIARQWEFHATVHDFEAEAARALDGEPPEAPGLLLLDRWALLNDERRALLERFDESNPSWVGLMEPWNPGDPECAANGVRLRRMADDVLYHLRGDRRRIPGTDTLASLEEFENALPRAALQAMHAFEDLHLPPAPQQQPDPQARAKPTLRDATERGALQAERSRPPDSTESPPTGRAPVVPLQLHEPADPPASAGSTPTGPGGGTQ
ncbi:TIR-like protein FxsC [Streptacidiphilus monticola]|uniref:TIR-like protein FxsC n=1 Tax=Streptacidiphilus monticola TaxID=2161674 RepID=A0ABW1G8A7_9ACTN